MADALSMWFWPFSPAAETQLSYVAGAPLLANLHRFVLFTVTTSSLGWDTGRAVTNHDNLSLALELIQQPAHVVDPLTQKGPGEPQSPFGGVVV